MNIAKHPLFVSLKELRGNARASVLTEPMFGIPFNMFAPYVSVYMLALGLNDQQIGNIASISLVVQIFTALVSGALVDKFGRRLTLAIGDIVCWVIPSLVWAFAQDIRAFLIAAVLNATWRISHTAWTCFTVEDAEERHIVHIWTWITIFMMATAFFAPAGGWLVGKFGLVPAVRGMYLFGFVMLLSKVAILYFFSTETRRGVVRREETRHTSLLKLLGEYGEVFKQVLDSRAIHTAMALMVITNIYQVVRDSFWGVLFTQKLGFENQELAIYAMVRSVFMTLGFFVLGHRFSNPRKFKWPLWLGFGLSMASQVLLLVMPERNVPLLVASVLIEGLAGSLVAPMIESMMALALESKDRARVSAMVYTALIAVISPFGWIAGRLSSIDRSLPFAMNAALFVIGGVLVWVISRPGFMTKLAPMAE